MIHNIINTIITFIVSGILGYCVNTIKNYKKREKEKNQNENMQNEALLAILQNNLTNTYFVYEPKSAIPDYIYKNWLNLLKVYENLGGNDYIHILADKMKKWEILKTDIL